MSRTDLPPGYPEAPDSRGRARKSVNGTLIELGMHGTQKSIERYKSLGLDKAHLEATEADAPFVGDYPLGYPQNADARGDAMKSWDGKTYYFGKHGTKGSVEKFNASPVGKAFSAALAAGKQDGTEWIDLDGTRWVTDTPLGDHTIVKYRLDVGAAIHHKNTEGRIRAKKVPMSSAYYCEFVWVYHAQDAHDLAKTFDMPPHLNLAELYSPTSIKIADAGADYRLGDILTLQGGACKRPVRIKVKGINDAGGITVFSIAAAAYSEPPVSPAGVDGGHGAGFAVNAKFGKGRFGRWKILGLDDDLSQKKKRHWWRVRCTCAKRTERSVSARALLSRKSTSCGCHAHRWDSSTTTKEHEKTARQIVDGVEYWAPRVMMAFLDVSWTVLDEMWSATATATNKEGRNKRVGCPLLPGRRAIRSRILSTAKGRKIKYFVAADGRCARKAKDRREGIPTPADATRLEEAAFELDCSEQTLRRLFREAGGRDFQKESGRAKDGRSVDFVFVPNWFVKRQKHEWEPAPSSPTDSMVVETITKKLDEHREEIVDRIDGTRAEIVEKLEQKNVEPQPTIYHYGDKSYSLVGATPQTVSQEEHNVLAAFATAKRSLSTEQIERAGCANVSRVMGQLIQKFPGAAMKSPGKGAGYFIRVLPVPTK